MAETVGDNGCCIQQELAEDEQELQYQGKSKMYELFIRTETAVEHKLGICSKCYGNYLKVIFKTFSNLSAISDTIYPVL